MLALSSPSFQAFFATKSSLYLLLLFFFWFSVLVVSKIAIGLGLVRYAGTYTPTTLTQHSGRINSACSGILETCIALLYVYDMLVLCICIFACGCHDIKPLPPIKLLLLLMYHCYCFLILSLHAIISSTTYFSPHLLIYSPHMLNFTCFSSSPIYLSPNLNILKNPLY